MKSKLVFKVWQVFYHNESKAEIESGFIPYNNCGVVSKAYENDVIIDVWLNKRNEWIDADYVGVLSWRLKQKTGLRAIDIFNKIALTNEAVYSFPLKNIKTHTHAFAPPYKRKQYKNILRLIKEVDKQNLFDFKFEDYPIKENIWCNYWVCSPNIFDYYCTNYLSKVMMLFERTKDNDLLEALELTETHRAGVQYSVVAFFLEGLFSVFLDQEKIKHIKIIA